MSYYDGTKILSMKDLNREKPVFYIVTGNRTGGKTTYFARLMINNFLKHGKKFMLLYRFKYELSSISDQFFKDIKSLFFNGYDMASKPMAKGCYQELFLNEESCGYAVAINSADTVKRYSHVFSDVSCIMFDEFQSETNHYCVNEVEKFLSIIKSVSRGQGQQYRYVPVYMLSNPVTLLNPYFSSMGISHRLRAETKFLRGNGFVLEQGFNISAKEAQENSGVNKAFCNEKYNAYSSEGVYLNDSKTFIEKMSGYSKYICTLKYNNKEYAIREYPEQGIIYCDTNIDITFKRKICVNTSDHDVNYIMLKQNSVLLSYLQYYFVHGVFRFKDLQCKEAVISALSL